MSAEPAAFALGRIPRIDFGPGAAARIPGIVARHGRRVLLVTGGRSLAASGRRDTLLTGMAEAGLELSGEVVVTGEPSPAVVDAAVARHRSAAVEVVLGVGGGSVLDAAKAVAGLLRTGTSARDHLEGVPPQLPYPGPAVPFVAVPTTAGTGSEATRNAVLGEVGPDGFKRSLRDERLVALDAVVDPDLLAGAPRSVIAANGMDALTQLVEAYLSLRAGPVTDALALAGIGAARDSLLRCHADPDGPDAAASRSGMALAALLSGICLANAGLGAVHGLASPIGARFPVPHGAACGATLAAATEVNLRALESRASGSPALVRYAIIGRLLGDLPEPTPAPEAREALLDRLRAWTLALEIPGLGAWGVDERAIPGIVADARGSSMRTNPVVLTDDELAEVLSRSL